MSVLVLCGFIHLLYFINLTELRDFLNPYLLAPRKDATEDSIGDFIFDTGRGKQTIKLTLLITNRNSYNIPSYGFCTTPPRSSGPTWPKN